MRVSRSGQLEIGRKRQLHFERKFFFSLWVDLSGRQWEDGRKGVTVWQEELDPRGFFAQANDGAFANQPVGNVELLSPVRRGICTRCYQTLSWCKVQTDTGRCPSSATRRTCQQTVVSENEFSLSAKGHPWKHRDSELTIFLS